MKDREKLRLIAALIGESTEPTFVVDMGGKIAAWSETAARFFEVSQEEALGKTCAALLKGCSGFGEPLCRFPCPALQQVEGGSIVPAQDMSVALGRHPGRRTYVRAYHLAIHDEQRRPIGVLHLLGTSPWDLEVEEPDQRIAPWLKMVPGQFLG